MQLYLFRFLDGRGRTSREVPLQAFDDEDALQLASLSSGIGAIEVWRGEVRVGLAIPPSLNRNSWFFRRFADAGRG
ncbi:MAG: hypothetical protein J7485_12440 [Sphingobium sp.]|nr:hypothetical protein [Sphingobium sp.]